MVGHGVRELVTQAMDHRNEKGIRNPIDLLREIEALDAEEGARFVETMRAFNPRIVVNGVRSGKDVQLGFSVRSICRKYYGFDAEYLGYVSYDEGVRRSVLSRRPLLELAPRCDASIYLARVARKLAGASPAAPRATPTR